MYGIFTYIGLSFLVNVGEYTTCHTWIRREHHPWQDNLKIPLLESRCCTSQSLSPASQPKSSDNSSTKMVRVRPLFGVILFGKNVASTCFHMCVFFVYLPNLDLRADFGFDLPIFLEKSKVESSNADESHKKKLPKNQLQHIQARGGLKNPWKQKLRMLFLSFYTITQTIVIYSQWLGVKTL